MSERDEITLQLCVVQSDGCVEEKQRKLKGIARKGFVHPH